MPHADSQQPTVERPEKQFPVINWSLCDGTASCVTACPHDVLAIQPLGDAQVRKLSIQAQIRSIVSGREKAFLQHPDACNTCAQCVIACPEQAISLNIS